MSERLWTTEQMIEFARSALDGDKRAREIAAGAPLAAISIDEAMALVEAAARDRFPGEYAARWPTK